MSDPNHNETKPKSGYVGQAAQAVASYCLLPDPRSFGKRALDFTTNFWRASQWQSQQDCIKREIAAKVPAPMLATPKTETYTHIMQHAQQFAAAGVAQCQVRDFEDIAVVPKAYYGYRGADHECHVTNDKNVAATARARLKQTR